MYTDSHLHFDSFDREGQAGALVERALAARVSRLVAIGGSTEANARAVRMAEAHPGTVFATVGYDRDEAGNEIDLREMNAQLARDEVVGVGETGLDYHYSADSAEEQKALFQVMLEQAAAFTKPVVIHSREADADTLALLRVYTASWQGDHPPGVLHCFTGSLPFAEQLMELGLLISFSGIVTFKNAAALREVAQAVPADRLLIETDAPYLAPAPHRGKTNEPAFVIHVAELLAELRGTTAEEIGAQSTANAARMFRFPPGS